MDLTVSFVFELELIKIPTILHYYQRILESFSLENKFRSNRVG